MEKILHTLVDGTVHTNNLLKQLLNAPTLLQTLDDNKKGENDKLVSIIPQPQETVDVPSTSTLPPPESKKRRSGTQSQRDAKKVKMESADKRRQVRETTMTKKIEDE